MLIGMPDDQHAPHAIAPLPDKEFAALRSWAMDFRAVRGVGAAITPSGYTPEQTKRLLAIANGVPDVTWLIRGAIFTIVWFAIGCLLIFVAMLPLAAALSRDPNVSGGALALALGGVIAGMLAAYTLGSLGASWLAGRAIAAFTTLAAFPQAGGDADLLKTVRRQVARIAKFGAWCAAACLLMLFVVRLV